MKIINHKTSTPRHAFRYNEKKVEDGLAVVLGSTISSPDLSNKPSVSNAELALVVAKNQKRENPIDHFGKQMPLFEVSAEVTNRVNILTGTMEQFAHRKHLKPNAKTFIHLKVSFHPDDNPKLTNRLMRKSVEHVLDGLGYMNNPYVIYRHLDTAHPHAHVVISRVDFNGRLISDSFDGLKFRQLEREIAEQFELTASAGQLLSEAGVRKTQKWEGERMSRTGEKSFKLYVQTAIIEAMEGQPSLEIFVQRLERRGIQVAHKITRRQDKVYHGLSYKIQPELFTADFTKLKISKDLNESLADEGAVDKNSLVKLMGINGDYSKNWRGLPEFCPNGTKSTQLKPYNFRAAMLGPFFQFENIKKNLSQENWEKVLNRITVFQKNYSTLPLFTRDESQAETNFILATEHRMSKEAKQLIRENPGINQKVQKKLTKSNIMFLNEIMKQHEERVLAPHEQYEEMFHRSNGHKPDSTTREFLRILSNKDYAALTEFLNHLEEKQMAGPEIMVNTTFNLPAEIIKKIESLDKLREERQEELTTYYLLSIGKEPTGKELKTIQLIANGNPEQLKEMLRTRQYSFDKEFLKQVLASMDLSTEMKAALEEIRLKQQKTVSVAKESSLAELIELYKTQTGQQPSESTQALINAIQNKEPSLFDKVLNEFRYYPDDLQPDYRLATILKDFISKEQRATLEEAFKPSENFKSTRGEQTKALLEALSIKDVEKAWETILKDHDKIEYSKITYDLILPVTTKDRNLYHLLMAKAHGVDESQPVAKVVEQMIADGINPIGDQRFAISYDSDLAKSLNQAKRKIEDEERRRQEENDQNIRRNNEREKGTDLSNDIFFRKPDKDQP